MEALSFHHQHSLSVSPYLVPDPNPAQRELREVIHSLSIKNSDSISLVIGSSFSIVPFISLRIIIAVDKRRKPCGSLGSVVIFLPLVGVVVMLLGLLQSF
jgi:hypothetical protein